MIILNSISKVKPSYQKFCFICFETVFEDSSRIFSIKNHIMKFVHFDYLARNCEVKSLIIFTKCNSIWGLISNSIKTGSQSSNNSCFQIKLFNSRNLISKDKSISIFADINSKNGSWRFGNNFCFCKVRSNPNNWAIR